MGFYDYGYPRYVSAAEKKAKADKAIAKLRKKDPSIEPVILKGRTLAKSWWGKAWNINLESYADYRNRIARGRTYVRSGSVLDLKIQKGNIKALVQGSGRSPYKVTIEIDTLKKENWDRMTELCNHKIDSLEQLMEGKFPKELEQLFLEKKYGLFPSPKEIHFDCSCPDGAYMCKHVAAVLYGMGARLDQNPMLFFELRAIDSTKLIKKSMESKLNSMLKNAGKKSEREIQEEDIFDIFGV